MTSNDMHTVVIRRVHQQHDDERRELQQLNDTMGQYIRRVKDLEARGYDLRSQVNALLKGWDAGSIELRKKYDKDLNSLRKQLDMTTCNMLLAQIQAIRADSDKGATDHQIGFVHSFVAADQQRALFCAQECERSKAELASILSQLDGRKQEIDKSKAELKRQLDYVQNLNKEYDTELMSRVVLEIELQTLREELVFTRAIFEEQNNELLSLSSIQLDVTQFYRDELTRAVANIKKDFELLARARHQEWEEYYRVKTEHLQQEITEYKRKKAEALHSPDLSLVDTKVVRAEVDEGRKYLIALRSENSTLAQRLRELEDEFANLKFNATHTEEVFTSDYSALQTEYLALQAAISNIHENNVSNQFEINTYRRLLEGVMSNTPVVKTRDVSLLWVNSATADFSAADSQNYSVLKWADNFKVSSGEITLEVSIVGPRNSSGVSFKAIYYTAQNRVIIHSEVTDLYNFNNYGQYQVTLYYPNSRSVISTWPIHLEPKTDICMPKQFIIRDSINNLLADATVQLKLRGQVIFTGKTDATGIVNIPRGLHDNSYEVEIDTHKSQYKVARFVRIVYRNHGPDSVTYFIYRQVKEDEVEFLLTWGKQPKDLDSHVYVSDGRHVYFSHKIEPNVSLDYDCRDGSGPETIKLKLERGMKYVYAVHRYSKDGELARSDATVTISTNSLTGPGESTRIIRVPYADQPNANFWIVCAIDGTSKQFKFFPRGEFEDQDNCSNDAFIRKYFNI